MRLRWIPIQTLAISLTFLCLRLPLAGQHSYRDLKQNGPKNLVIVYRCTPQDRIPLRNYMSQSGLQHFRDWQKQRVLESFQVLFNRYVDSETWDMLAVLRFRNSTDLGGWAEIERSFTGGLEPSAAKLISSATTYSMDLVSTSASVTQEDGKGVFLVIPYALEIPPDEYFNYVLGYVEPQLQGWVRQGVLSRWSLFVNRYFPGRAWQSLLILEYKSESALGQRDKVIAEVRSQLSGDPSWKSFSDSKQRVRQELQVAIADALAP